MSHGGGDHLNAPRWLWWQIFVFGVLTIVCGAIGVSQYDQEHFPGEPHGLSPLYHAFQMLIMHTAHFDQGVNLWIEIGRWSGVLTVFSATAALFGRRFLRECRLLHLTCWSGHHVICGLGQKGFALAMLRQEQDSSARIVILDPAPEEHLLEECERRGICVIVADASQARKLRQARIAYASEVIVITNEDGINLRIAAAIRQQLGASPQSEPLCHVHLSDIHLREALERGIGPGGAPAAMQLHFFDVFDSEARRVLNAKPYLDGTGIRSDDPRSVHVVILGFGRMGRSLALQAARLGHFANGRPLRISVIDRDAHQQRERLLFRHPIFAGEKLCALTFHSAEAESLTARNLIRAWADEAHALLHLFICLDDDARGLEVALRLRALLRGRPGSSIRVRIHSRTSLAPILDAIQPPAPEDHPAPVEINHFGMVEDAWSEGAFVHDLRDQLARQLHQEFVNERLAGSRRLPENDEALFPWEDLRYDFRQSNRHQADHIAIKLRAIGCELAETFDARPAVEHLSPAEIAMLAPVEHQRWNAERWLAGWVYGTPSNKALRINENLVSWAELDPSIRLYDEQAVERIPAVLKRAMPDWKIVRITGP